MAESDEQSDQVVVVDVDKHLETASDLERQIIRQVEYYYGDHNIVKDKFLRDQIGPNYDNWVPLETMVKFKRLADLSTDFDVIVTALGKSTSGLMEISEDRKSIRRSLSHPVPLLTTEYRIETKKGFPPEIALDQLQDFLDQHGKIAAIQMRRSFEKKFKGSAFIEFMDVSEAKQFVEAETIQYKDNKIERLFKADYWRAKDKRKREKLDEERKTMVTARAEETAKDDDDSEEKLNGKEKEEDKEEEEINYDTGCILHFQDVGEQTSREDLKELFHEKEEVCWVEYNRGDTSGHVRFKGDGSAKRAMDSLMKEHSGKLEIRGVETTLRVLEGKEEKEYWKRVSGERKKSLAAKAKRGQKRERGRGGRWGSHAKRSRRNED